LTFLNFDYKFYTKLIKQNYDNNKEIFFRGLIEGAKTSFSSGNMIEYEREVEVEQE